MNPKQELVILVDERNTPIGTMPKSEVHTDNTPLHRGFSSFIFNKQGGLLLQQRSHKKITWPLIWSNTCCGHPLPDEAYPDAVKRRLEYELGLTDIEIHEVLPEYRYRAEKDGIVENEFCPVFVGFSDSTPRQNPDEVEALRYVSWNEFVEEVKVYPEHYSPWCSEESQQLDQNNLFKSLLSNNIHI